MCVRPSSLNASRNAFRFFRRFSRDGPNCRPRLLHWAVGKWLGCTTRGAPRAKLPSSLPGVNRVPTSETDGFPWVLRGESEGFTPDVGATQCQPIDHVAVRGTIVAAAQVLVPKHWQVDPAAPFPRAGGPIRGEIRSGRFDEPVRAGANGDEVGGPRSRVRAVTVSIVPMTSVHVPLGQLCRQRRSTLIRSAQLVLVRYPIL
jgi:hypothetical protein